MKGIYLASYKAYHPGYDIVYQDFKNRQGGFEVFQVIDNWLDSLKGFF